MIRESQSWQVVDHSAGGSQGWSLLCPLRLFIRRQALTAGAQRPAVLILYSRLCFTRSPDKPRPPRSQGLPSSSQCLAVPLPYSRQLAARSGDLCKPGTSTVQSQRMALNRGRSSHQDPSPSAHTPDHLR